MLIKQRDMVELSGIEPLTSTLPVLESVSHEPPATTDFHAIKTHITLYI